MCLRTIARLALLVGAALPAHAALPPGAKDHPLITRFKGSELVDYKLRDFDEATLPVKPIDIDSPVPPAALMKVEGKVTGITYRLPSQKTALEAMRNYEQALAGYRTVFRCAGNECGRNFAGFVGGSGKVVPDGWTATFNAAANRYLLAEKRLPTGDVYVLVYAMQENETNPVLVYQEVVEMQPMQAGQVTVVDAVALERGLRTEGRVALYGLYFDTAKAEVKPESKPSLDEMARLLTQHPLLKVYIVGHTDNAGALAANVDLSQRRAEAVAKALVAGYKIDPARMVPRGVASLSPVASNADEAGRARNRRVELVVQ